MHLSTLMLLGGWVCGVDNMSVKQKHEPFGCHSVYLPLVFGRHRAPIAPAYSFAEKCCVPRQAVLSLVVSLVLSRLDYGSATFVGLPVYQIDRLQSVLNAAARLVYSSRRYDRVTPLLRELHWLRMSQRINYKLAVLVYRCLNGLAPLYLASDLQ